jgi:hypothetical protein
MSDSEEELIRLIQQKAAGIKRFEDNLAFDKYLSELDLLVYELRRRCFSPRRPGDKWLEELEREIRDDISQATINTGDRNG